MGNPKFTAAELTQRFADFDELYFDGELAALTSAEVEPRMTEEHEDGATRRDGSVIYINPFSDHRWELTLIHEMCHAWECLKPGAVAVTPEAEEAHRWSVRNASLHEEHSAEFFAKLFEVMRTRGDDPSPDGDDFAEYFG